MPRPLKRRQVLQNQRFLRMLAETGNARLSAREAGVKYGTIQHRRSVHAGFAREWEAALDAADARLREKGGRRDLQAKVRARLARALRPASTAAAQDEPRPRGACTDPSRTPLGYARDERALRARDERGLRTEGGEPMVARTKMGRLQLRPAVRDRLTRGAERAFLETLSATANKEEAARSVGASSRAFRRRRRQYSAFAADAAEATAAGHAGAERAAKEQLERAAREAERLIDEGPIWPVGLTIAEALRILGAPPLRLPGTPFSQRRA